MDELFFVQIKTRDEPSSSLESLECGVYCFYPDIETASIFGQIYVVFWVFAIFGGGDNLKIFLGGYR